MSTPTVAKSLFIPPPVDGLNQIASPASFLPTEARILDNYLVYDDGIRQVGAPATNANVTGSPNIIGMLFPYFLDDGSARLLMANNQKIYRLSSASGSPTDKTGTACSGSTTNIWNPCFHNKRIFLFDGINTPKVHDRADGSNCADFNGTGPTIANLIQGFTYKRRLRVIQKDSTSYWYSPVDDVGTGAGAYTQVDLGTVFETGGNLWCGFSWSINQGLSSEELACFMNISGEVVVYSGDYEGAANWQVIARVRLPAVDNATAPQSRQPFIKTANDVYFVTKRGAVSFSSVFTGAFAAAPLYTLSRKIKDRSTFPCTPAIDPSRPFIFFSGEDKGTSLLKGRSGYSDSASIFVLNYERGAWSRIILQGLTLSRQPYSLAVFGDVLMIGTGGTGVALHYLDLSDSSYATSAMSYKWATGWFDFGTPLQKHSKHIRVLGTNYEADGSFKNTASISTQYTDLTSPATSSATTALSANVNTLQELAPPGTGSRFSYYFNRSGTTGVSEKNVIQGFEATYELGGDR